MSLPHFDSVVLPGYPQDFGLLLGAVQDSTREWQDELGEVSPDLLCWQPYPQGYSIGALLLHIAEVEAYWVEELSLGRTLSPEELETYKGIDQMNGVWPVPPHEPLEYYYEILRTVRARTLESVKSFEEPDAVKSTHWGSMTLRWVLAHVVGHDSYHGGQAVMLKALAEKLDPSFQTK